MNYINENKDYFLVSSDGYKSSLLSNDEGYILVQTIEQLKEVIDNYIRFFCQSSELLDEDFRIVNYKVYYKFPDYYNPEDINEGNMYLICTTFTTNQ